MTGNKNNLIFLNYEDDEIKDFTHMKNASIWKGLLSAEEYIERERVLGSTSIANKDQNTEIQKLYPGCSKWLGVKYFIVKNQDLPDTGKYSQIVSSCETLNRIGYCIRPGSNNKELEPALIICIGGVFTEAKYRGKGYAAYMINSLNNYYDNIRAKYGTNCQMIQNMVITLYSEVDDYYEKFGYHSMHIPLHNITNFDPILQQYCKSKSATYSHSSDCKEIKTVKDGEFLGFDGYEDLIMLQDTQFKQKLCELAEREPNKFIFTVKPDLDIFIWFHVRDLFIRRKLCQTDENNNNNNSNTEIPFGFVLTDNSHVIWHHHWSEDTLILLKVYIADNNTTSKEDILRKLIKQCILEAQRRNLSKVQFWNEEIPLKSYPELNQILTTLEDESQLYEANGSISAVRPPIGLTPEDIIWDNNTKFCWF